MRDILLPRRQRGGRNAGQALRFEGIFIMQRETHALMRSAGIVMSGVTVVVVVVVVNGDGWAR
jgi:hypothetical protein